MPPKPKFTKDVVLATALQLLREKGENPDVLAMTATPIPRTLHMSMTGIRDMSVIETPPTQRTPVQTYVLEYSDSMTRSFRSSSCEVVNTSAAATYAVQSS